jgi:hypothetical protein
MNRNRNAGEDPSQPQQPSRRNEKKSKRKGEAVRIKEALTTEIEEGRVDKGRPYLYLPIGNFRDRSFLEAMVEDPFAPELEPLASVLDRINTNVLKNGRQLAIRISLKCVRSGRGKVLTLPSPTFTEARQAVNAWLTEKAGPECAKNEQVRNRLRGKVDEATNFNGIRNLFHNAGATIAIILVVIVDGEVVKSYSDEEAEGKPEAN